MRRPFEVNVSELLQTPGVRAQLDLTGSLEDVVLASSATRVPDDAEVRFEGRAEAQGSQVMVHGTGSAPWTGECRRCLEATGGQLKVEVQEVFEEHPTEGETFPLANEVIDLGAVLRQALALELPLAPLCSDECRGPVPEAFDENEPPRDPRWAALDQLDFGSSPGRG